MGTFWRQFYNELWKLFGKKRTYIGFGMFLLAQNIILIAFQITKWEGSVARALEGNGYVAAEFISALTVAVYILLPQIILLMPLYVALVGGDMVAKEAEDGTLRMILSRPVSRVRLVMLKWLAGIFFSIALVLVLGGAALGFAACWFPWKGMFVFIPGLAFDVLDSRTGMTGYLLAQVFLAVNASVMFSIAFMFSCFNMKPAAATILALSYFFLNLVMDGLPFFEDYQHWFLPYHFRSWLRVFSDPTPWPQIIESQIVLLGFMLTALIVGATALQTRDIKS